MIGALQKIEEEQLRREITFRPGDTTRVHVRIVEGDKERVQVFEGVVIRIKRGGARATFTVRKVSYGVGVERVFPLHSPAIDKVEVIASGRVRRARLYFLRDLRGKKARLKDRNDKNNGLAAAVVSANVAPVEANA